MSIDTFVEYLVTALHILDLGHTRRDLFNVPKPANRLNRMKQPRLRLSRVPFLLSSPLCLSLPPSLPTYRPPSFLPNSANGFVALEALLDAGADPNFSTLVT